VWLSVKSDVQIVCIWFSRLVLFFWYRLTQSVLEKRPLNGCGVVVVVGIKWKMLLCVVSKGTLHLLDQVVNRAAKCLESRHLTALLTLLSNMCNAPLSPKSFDCRIISRMKTAVFLGCLLLFPVVFVQCLALKSQHERNNTPSLRQASGYG